MHIFLGNLYFSHVLPEDYSKGMYACVVKNSKTQTETRGNYARLGIVGSPSKLALIDLPFYIDVDAIHVPV